MPNAVGAVRGTDFTGRCSYGHARADFHLTEEILGVPKLKHVLIGSTERTAQVKGTF
jgi:hypothetical protein